jgi:hypothetical protein
VNEVYAKAKLEKRPQGCKEALDELLEDIKKAIEDVIDQPDIAKVKVQRWFPGVVEEIVEEVNEKSRYNITQRLLKEASQSLERKQHLQTVATQDNSVSQILGSPDVEKGKAALAPADGVQELVREMAKIDENPRPRRRVRQKMRSTPVVGGGLFGEMIEAKSGREVGTQRISDLKKKTDDLNWSLTKTPGVAADITVKGESFNIRISRDTYKDLQKGFGGQMVDSRGIEISGVNIEATDDAPVVQKLKGFVRNMPLNKITEENDGASEISASEVSGEIEHIAQKGE